MNRFKKQLAALVSASLMTAFTITFNACSEQSPFNPNNKDGLSNTVLTKPGGGGKGPKFVSLKGGHAHFRTDEPVSTILAEASQHVTYTDGGELILEYKGVENPQDGNGNLYVKTTLKVFSQTISEDADLVLRMYDDLSAGNVDVSFEPHGITYSQPALLNIEVLNADLSGLSKGKKSSPLSLYYVNQETGQWERMQTYDIVVNETDGYIKIIDAQIPHFSRYAIGAGE